MTKGFVTPMVVALAIVFLCWGTGRWRWVLGLRPGMGVVIVAAPLGAWLYFVAQYKGGLGAYAGVVWQEFFVRGVAGSKEGHFWPPGLHTVALAVLFWPGSLMTLAGFVRAWKRARGTSPTRQRGSGSDGLNEAMPADGASGAGPALPRLRFGFVRGPWTGRAAELFLIAWIVPAWIVFELSPAKLLHYTMPMLPAVALLSARMVLAAGAATRLAKSGTWIWELLGSAALASALVWALAATLLSDWSLGLRYLTIAAAGGVCLGLAIRNLGRQRIPHAQLWSLPVMCPLVVVGVPLSYGLHLVPGWASWQLGSGIEMADRSGQLPIASLYHADSFVYQTRGRAERIATLDMERWLARHTDGLAIVAADAVPEGWSTLLRIPSGAFGAVKPEDWVLIQRKAAAP